MRTLSAVLLVAVALAVSGCGVCMGSMCNTGVGGGSGGGGGTGGGGGLDLYDRYTLDTQESDRFYMALVADKTRNRVGIAYIAGTGEVPIIYLPGDAGITTDGGSSGFYDVKYVEWEDGMVKMPQNVDRVQRMAGISIDFHPTTGEPAIGYLGGGNDGSLYWHNSDAELATRTGGSNWSTDIAAANGFQVMCGNPVSDQPAGVIVGIWPAIKYDTAGTLTYCYRDVHTGQYPQGDWAGSDIECVRGQPRSWTRECTLPGGNDKNAPGGRIQLVMVNDVPYIFWDQAFGGADTSGQNVFMQVRTGVAPNYWTRPPMGVLTVAGTQHGASAAYDTMEGLGVAVLDVADNVLRYVSKALAAPRFNTADPVFGDGTGGWYPSLAMDVTNHEPAIAFYVCSDRPNASVAQCKPDFDEVRVAHRNNTSNMWNIETVDTASVTTVKLGFLPNGRKAIAYREKNGALKLAVRKVP